MKDNKYENFDKEMTKEIMGEFKGQTIDTTCYQCNGEGKVNNEPCDNCNGEGHYLITY